MNQIVFAAGVLLFPAVCTTLGAAGVFLLRRSAAPRTQRVLSGMAAGIMLAASVWSLLLPAIERTRELGVAAWVPPSAGLVLGAAGLLRLESMAGQLLQRGKSRMVLAVTLHNLPEGMVVGLAAALALGMSIPASAQKSEAARVSVPAVCAGAPASPAGDEEPDKTETVTVKANPDGTARKITVETVLKQQEGEKLVDRTNLRDIRNTEGEEEYTLAADGTLLWDNLGEAIHYKGESDAQLPVTVNITYTLDGQPITPEELAGKSGRVGIRFDYENHTEYAARVNGTDRTVQVPFLAFTALMLDEEKFNA